jgi:hypothetical protein
VNWPQVHPAIKAAIDAAVLAEAAHDAYCRGARFAMAEVHYDAAQQGKTLDELYPRPKPMPAAMHIGGSPVRFQPQPDPVGNMLYRHQQRLAALKARDRNSAVALFDAIRRHHAGP